MAVTVATAAMAASAATNHQSSEAILVEQRRYCALNAKR